MARHSPLTTRAHTPTASRTTILWCSTGSNAGCRAMGVSETHARGLFRELGRCIAAEAPNVRSAAVDSVRYMTAFGRYGELTITAIICIERLCAGERGRPYKPTT